MNSFPRRDGRKPGFRAAALPMLLGLMVGACTFDPDDRCGPHQKIYGDNESCVCVEGAALTATGCVPCGEHEVAGSASCVCASGYSRSAEGAACEPVPQGFGAACSADQPCSDATYGHCQPAASETGYCTSVGCASSSECSGGYACDLSASPSVCKRPPLGQGKSCVSASDCAGSEATFCETFMVHQCLVQNCTLSPNDCFEGWVCMDLSMFGLPNLCTPGSAP